MYWCALVVLLSLSALIQAQPETEEKGRKRKTPPTLVSRQNYPERVRIWQNLPKRSNQPKLWHKRSNQPKPWHKSYKNQEISEDVAQGTIIRVQERDETSECLEQLQCTCVKTKKECMTNCDKDKVWCKWIPTEECLKDEIREECPEQCHKLLTPEPSPLPTSQPTNITGILSVPTCKFPFIYKGVTYWSCTRIDHIHGKLWCSTDTDFQNNYIPRMWMDCADAKATCKFPFIYKGVTYSACTRIDEVNGELWCSTETDNENNYIDKKWIHCPYAKATCKFPFIYKGVTYSACTRMDEVNGNLWCSTETDNENNYIERKWMHCADAQATWTTTTSTHWPLCPLYCEDGGVCVWQENCDPDSYYSECKQVPVCQCREGYSGDRCQFRVPTCKFPFIYKGVTYWACTRIDHIHGKLWCSTETDFQNNYIPRMWMDCADAKATCKFPFIYKGVTYSACTRMDEANGNLWCSTETDNENNYIERKWIHCAAVRPTCKFPFIYKGVTYSACTRIDEVNGKLWCSTETDNENNYIERKWMHCDDAPPTCKFPFIYKGVTYSACTQIDNIDGPLWCSTETDHLNNYIEGEWMICADGPPTCKFPFIYKGVTYSACTRIDDVNGKRWCSTETDNQNNHINGMWMNCPDTQQ